MNLIETADRLLGFSAADPMRKAAIIVGLAAVIENLFIFTSNKRERIIVLKIVSDMLWVVQYALFGTPTGSVLNLIAVGRETVFYNRGRRKWADSPAWMWFFIAIMLASPVYESVTSGFTPLLLLPAVGSALAVVGFYCQKTAVTKAFLLVASLAYLVYNSITGNFMGVLGTAAPVVSTSIGLIHELFRGRGKRAEEEAPGTDEEEK